MLLRQNLSERTTDGENASRSELDVYAPPRPRLGLRGEMQRGEEKAGGATAGAPGKTGYFTESGAGTGGADVSGAGGGGAGLRLSLSPRNGSTPNSISFSLLLPR